MRSNTEVNEEFEYLFPGKDHLEERRFWSDHVRKTFILDKYVKQKYKRPLPAETTSTHTEDVAPLGATSKSSISSKGRHAQHEAAEAAGENFNSNSNSSLEKEGSALQPSFPSLVLDEEGKERSSNSSSSSS